MTISKGVYAAGLSLLNEDLSLNLDLTVKHAENLIKNGLSGVFFFGSTGMSQLLGLNEKKALISKISNHKQKNNFFLGTGNNSLKDNIELISHGMKNHFYTYLIMPPAYYPKNDEGVYNFYKEIITIVPKIKIVLYNFEKLSGYKFSIEIIEKLVKDFPNQIVGVKDSTYNLYEKIKIPNFLVFPGSETKLLKGLELGCSGIISAVCNCTAPLARKVFEDFQNNKEQTVNSQLIRIRKVFDNYQLISALHSLMSINDKIYKNILPPLTLLTEDEKKELINKLKEINFINQNNLAA